MHVSAAMKIWQNEYVICIEKNRLARNKDDNLFLYKSHQLRNRVWTGLANKFR